MLNNVALGLLVFVGLVTFYGIIAIHDIPYEIAKHRRHPHRDAIHVAGWVSLFTLHVLWPFLWIWATLYREDRGWGFTSDGDSDSSPAGPVGERIQQQLQQLNARLQAVESATPGRVTASSPVQTGNPVSDVPPFSAKSSASSGAEGNQ